MLLTDNEITERINSPLNLLNRLRHTGKSEKPYLNPSNIYGVKTEQLIPDVETQISEQIKAKAEASPRTAVADAALDLAIKAAKKLDLVIETEEKPSRLAGIIRDMSQVVKNTEIEDPNRRSNVQFIFHVPEQKKEQDYEVIDV